MAAAARHGGAGVPRAALDREHPPFRVLYTGATLLAVDKPAGIIVHGDGTGARTLTDAVGTAVDEGLVPDVPRSCSAELQPLQRLDRETTGIVLFSLRKETQPLYDRMLSEHACTKRYLAIVEGRVPWDDRALCAAIGRDRHDSRRMRASRTGKPARTLVHVADRRKVRGRWLSLLEVEIETGRRHQIRVHLSHEGFPLLGDDLYGRADPRGLMLHACEMAFVDPVSGAPVDIESAAPARFSDLFPRSLGR